MQFHISKRLVIFSIVALVLLLGILSISFVSAYRKVAPERLIDSERVLSPGKGHVTLGLGDVSSISSWMTFDYINQVFGLPADYLRSALGITDPRYPDLTLARYSRGAAIDSGLFTAQVENAVRNYFAASASR